MQIVKTIPALQAALKIWRQAGEIIAFVPTMGNLHDGHLKLVEDAKNRANRVVVSIFVNPSQFGAGEDFDSYPRTEQEDQQKLQEIDTDLLFMPTIAEMYRPNAQTVVSVTGISDQYCGASRPGHFSGVATIVCKLFNIVQPDIAVFGEKDFQQLAVIREMVRDLNMPVDIRSVATVREASGLAMSSRNNYLGAEEKNLAALLYQSLCTARDAVLTGNQANSEIERQAMCFLQGAGFQPDYFSICRRQDLRAAAPEDAELVILAAAKLGKTRLIDNISFMRQLQ
ncbi:MAG: pantoate--beta-alanine ligase [Methylovulum sp.]|uniref:pantoate--beta-alanine ligase n=1 Tax=Methylovulum sp. TaxID=1916980 RepID=UPI00262DD62A|nr:pantoate--beta-alanine ligase [Methylovulum sp.]MDD2723349.1 pantoate--beta-alanine ligase [Methylovulum sp.]MDD5125340.1 pantoate--beta-alanine ligase [Methylovulum sp.]